MKKSLMNPNESLTIISEIIETEKMRFSENGFIYRFWGWIVAIAAFAQFVLLQMELYNYHYYPWFLTIAGGIYTGIYYSKKKEKSTLPMSGRVLAFTWILIALNIFLIAFVFPVKANELLLFIILSHVAVGSVVAGALLKFKALIYGGIICNLIAFVSLLVSYEYWSILTVLAIISSNLIPGYLMKKEYKQSHL